jgi:hypothetical protein
VAYNFQTGKNKVKLLRKCEVVTQKVLFYNLYTPHCCMGENMTAYFEMTTVQERECAFYGFSKQSSLSKRNVVIRLNMECAYFGFSKESPLSKRNAVTELNMEKIQLQIKLLPSEMDSQR